MISGHANMGIFKTFSWTTMVLIVLLIRHTFALPQAPDEEEQKKAAKCIEECGGLEEVSKSTSNGDWQCFTKEGMSVSASPCLTKCMDEKVTEDQTKCWCRMCKSAPQAAAFFCTGPGEGPLTADQCDPIVCEGKAQFRGMHGCQKKA